MSGIRIDEGAGPIGLAGGSIVSLEENKELRAAKGILASVGLSLVIYAVIGAVAFILLI